MVVCLLFLSIFTSGFERKLHCIRIKESLKKETKIDTRKTKAIQIRLSGCCTFCYLMPTLR